MCARAHTHTHTHSIGKRHMCMFRGRNLEGNEMIVWFSYSWKWCMFWWWFEQMARTSSNCKLLMVLLHGSIFNEYIHKFVSPYKTSNQTSKRPGSYSKVSKLSWPDGHWWQLRGMRVKNVFPISGADLLTHSHSLTHSLTQSLTVLLSCVYSCLAPSIHSTAAKFSVFPPTVCLHWLAVLGSESHKTVALLCLGIGGISQSRNYQVIRRFVVGWSCFAQGQNRKDAAWFTVMFTVWILKFISMLYTRVLRASVTKFNRLALCGENGLVYSKSGRRQKSALCEQNAGIFNVKWVATAALKAQ